MNTGREGMFISKWKMEKFSSILIEIMHNKQQTTNRNRNEHGVNGNKLFKN